MESFYNISNLPTRHGAAAKYPKVNLESGWFTSPKVNLGWFTVFKIFSVEYCLRLLELRNNIYNNSGLL